MLAIQDKIMHASGFYVFVYIIIRHAHDESLGDDRETSCLGIIAWDQTWDIHLLSPVFIYADMFKSQRVPRGVESEYLMTPDRMVASTECETQYSYELQRLFSDAKMRANE